MKASLHVFGKLPLAGDFLHYRLEADEGKAFADWMQRGQSLVEGILRSQKSPDPEAGKRRFRFSWDDGSGRRLAVGLLRESHDKGGLRRFPFALYATLDAGAFRERPALIASLCRGLWERLEAEMQTLPEAGSADAMVKRLDGLSLEVPDPGRPAVEDLERLLAGSRSGTFWAALFPGAGKERRVATFDLLARALGPFRKNAPQEIPTALKLPLGGGSADQASLAATFWIELLGTLIRSPRQAPSFFLDASGDGQPPRSLHLFFQKPDEKNFGSLMARSYESEYVDDLTAVTLPAGSHLALAEPLRRTLERDDVNLMDLVRQRWF